MRRLDRITKQNKAVKINHACAGILEDSTSELSLLLVWLADFLLLNCVVKLSFEASLITGAEPPTFALVPI